MTALIVLPPRIEHLLHANLDNYSLVTHFKKALEDWISSRPQTFFPEYTEHGASHINRVLSSSTFIISEDSWQILTSDDMLCLVLASCAHDAAMFFNAENFLGLLTDDYVLPLEESIGDLIWKTEWDSFLLESKYLDDRQIARIFGRKLIPRTPPNNIQDWTIADRDLIGEFIRRKHGRIGSEVITRGIPLDGQALSLVNPENLLASLLVKAAGLIARSHSLDLRVAADLCRQHYQDPLAGAHVTFLMSVLRIADAIHVSQDRARPEWLRYRTVENAYSKGEWIINQSVASVQRSATDPEAVYVIAHPTSPRAYRDLRNTLDSIQYELDKSWDILGEIYGGNSRQNISALGSKGLTVRRIRSNIDSEDVFKKTGFSFPTGDFILGVDDVSLMLLLVAPLYNYDETFSIRELLQNALDAVKERCSMDSVFFETSRTAQTVRLFIDIDDSGRPTHLRIVDEGIGMNTATISRYFLRIGSSFGHSPEWVKLIRSTELGASISRTGRFGVGVMAAFLLGDEIRVTTRQYKESVGYTFSVRLEDRNVDVLFDRSASVGTSISIGLRENISTKWMSQIRESTLSDRFPIYTHYFGTWPKVGCYVQQKRADQPTISCWEQNNTVPPPLEETNNAWWFVDVADQGRIHIQMNRILGDGQVSLYIDGMAIPETNISEGTFLSAIGGVRSIAISLNDPHRRLKINLNRTNVLLPQDILQAVESTFCEDVIARWLAEDVRYFDHTGGARSPLAFSRRGFIPLTTFGLQDDTLVEVVLRPGFLPSSMAPRSVASHPSAVEHVYRRVNDQIKHIFEACHSNV
jgi:molecular chaperone HtpG